MWYCCNASRSSHVSYARIQPVAVGGMLFVAYIAICLTKIQNSQASCGFVISSVKPGGTFPVPSADHLFTAVQATKTDVILAMPSVIEVRLVYIMSATLTITMTGIGLVAQCELRRVAC